MQSPINNDLINPFNANHENSTQPEYRERICRGCSQSCWHCGWSHLGPSAISKKIKMQAFKKMEATTNFDEIIDIISEHVDKINEYINIFAICKTASTWFLNYDDFSMKWPTNFNEAGKEALSSFIRTWQNFRYHMISYYWNGKLRDNQNCKLVYATWVENNADVAAHNKNFPVIRLNPFLWRFNNHVAVIIHCYQSQEIEKQLIKRLYVSMKQKN